MTELASRWLAEQGIAHEVIPIPDSLGYKTGSDVGIYVPTSVENKLEIPVLLTKQRFIVMRVFKDFEPS